MEYPSFENAEVEKEKIQEYLLKLEHPEGGSKAKFFLSRGFTVEEWGIFADALVQQAVRNTLKEMKVGRFGTKFVFEGVIECVDGKKSNIRTVWIIQDGRVNPRLVTAHPLR